MRRVVGRYVSVNVKNIGTLELRFLVVGTRNKGIKRSMHVWDRHQILLLLLGELKQIN